MLNDIKSFVWDTEKNKINIHKHGVTFAEAETVRIISARKAEKPEIELYKEGL